HDAVAADRAADNVVVEDGLDGNVGSLHATRFLARTNASLLFAGAGGKHERRIEVDPALSKHACQLHHQHGAAAIVICARRIGVVVLVPLAASGGIEARLSLITQ